MDASAQVVAKSMELGDQGAEAVPLRTGSGGSLSVLLGRRTGGRRYLSEDLQALRRAASVIGEQLEQWHRDLETRRLARSRPNCGPYNPKYIHTSRLML